MQSAVRHSLKTALVGAALAFSVMPARADLIDFTAASCPGTSSCTIAGVTFTESGSGSGGSGLGIGNWTSYFDNIAGASGGNGLNDWWGITDLVIDFGGSVSDVSILLSTGVVTTWTLSAFDAGNVLLGSTIVTMPANSDAVEAVLNFANIATVQITEPGDNGHISLFDDLRFSRGDSAAVPVPATLALLGLGLAGLGFTRRRAHSPA